MTVPAQCPDCHGHDSLEPAAGSPLLTLAAAPARSGHPYGHTAAVCAALLLGLTLLSVLAAAVSAGRRCRAPTGAP